MHSLIATRSRFKFSELIDGRRYPLMSKIKNVKLAIILFAVLHERNLLERD